MAIKSHYDLLPNIYGKELILDLHNCNPATFNRTALDVFFEELCSLIDMEKCDRYFWDDFGLPIEQCQTDPRTTGTSAIQFIKTSNITIHTLDLLKSVYVNLFSCKNFDADIATEYINTFFEGNIVNKIIIERK